MTMLDILLRPELVEQAWDYFRNVQTKDTKYSRCIRPEDKPAIWLNKEHMDEVPAGDEEVLLRSDEVPRPISSSWGSSTRLSVPADGGPVAVPGAGEVASPARLARGRYANVDVFSDDVESRFVARSPGTADSRS